MKWTPGAAEYRPTRGRRRCGTCVWLLEAPRGAQRRDHVNRCKVVAGGISWWWTCSLHTRWGEITRFFSAIKRLGLRCPP